MAMGPEGANYLPTLPLDQPVPRSVLGRRDGVSFSSSSSYVTAPRLERRGGISYDKTDKNALYVRSLGDVKMKGKQDVHREPISNLSEGDSKLLEKLKHPDCKVRFRTRFLSLHNVHRRRRPFLRVNKGDLQMLDEYYHGATEKLLNLSGCWDFDIFNFDVLTGGRCLLQLGFHFIRHCGFIEQFQLDTMKLLRFITLIEESYHENNSYHNIVHASDVTQAMHCYLQEDKMKETVPPFEIMMCLIASMCHDLDHPGVNQTFLIATGNALAKLYQNTSVLENHHWRCTVGLLQETGLFSHFSAQDWTKAISQIKSLILATDISRQQEYLVKFRRLLDGNELDINNPLIRHFVLQIALKCADISNPGREWYLSKKWSEQVCEEFFCQGDLEKAVGVPLTPVCDRQTNTVAKIQVGFIDVVVKPLFIEWQRFLPTQLSRNMMKNIALNKQHWLDSVDKEPCCADCESEAGSSPPAFLGCRTHIDSDNGDFLQNIEDEENDVVKNNINVSYHYQTDTEQSGELSSISEDEEAMLMANNIVRRHSTPSDQYKDLSYYMGLRREAYTVSNMRRQSLPASGLISSAFPLGRGNTGVKEKDQKRNRLLSVEELTWQPKISNLCSSVNIQLDYLNFLPLAAQTQMLQHGGWTRTHATAMPPQRESTSCLELYQQSQILRQDMARHVSQAEGGDGLIQPVLFGLASSWPSILRAGQKVVDADLKLMVDQAGPGSRLTSVEDSESGSLGSNDNSMVNCLSSQVEVVSSLNRPH